MKKKAGRPKKSTYIDKKVSIEDIITSNVKVGATGNIQKRSTLGKVGHLWAPSYSKVYTNILKWKEQREQSRKVLTKTSLAAALGVAELKTLIDIYLGKDCSYDETAPDSYNKIAAAREKIRPLITKAFLEIQSAAEDELFKQTGQTAGVIYSLDNLESPNWRSKAQTEINQMFNLGNLSDLADKRRKELAEKAQNGELLQ